MLLLLEGLLGGLGDLATSFLLVDGLDDTDGHGLLHVTDGETSEGSVLLEGLHAHGLTGNHLHDAGVTRLDELGVGFNLLTSTPVNLSLQFSELAGNVSSVAIQHRRVPSLDLTGVVEDDYLSLEVLGALGRVVLGVGGNVATLNILYGDVLDVETNVVAGDSLSKGFVVHLHGLDLSGQANRGKRDNHAGLDDASLHTTDGHRSNTADLVDVLKGKTEGLVRGPAGGFDVVQSIEEGLEFIG